MKSTDDFYESKALHVTGPNGNPLKVTMRKDLNGKYIATVHGKTGKTLPGGAGKTPKEALARTQKMISGTPKRVKWANGDKLDEADKRQATHLKQQLQKADKDLAAVLITLGPLSLAFREDLNDPDSADRINASINKAYEAKRLVSGVRKKMKAAK